jgi:hypothetical protein
LNFERVDPIRSNVVEGKLSRAIFYLIFSTSYFCIANIVKVPTRDASEVKDNLITGLICSIEAGAISGTAVVRSSYSALTERQT